MVYIDYSLQPCEALAIDIGILQFKFLHFIISPATHDLMMKMTHVCLRKLQRTQDAITLLYPLILVSYIAIILVLILLPGLTRRGDQVATSGISNAHHMGRVEAILRRKHSRMFNIRYHKDLYLHSTPPGDACFLRDKLDKPRMPTIHSVFAEAASASVVFVGVKWLVQKWHREKFFCVFDNGVVRVNDPIVDDCRSFGYLTQYIFIMTCPLPDQYLHQRSNFTLTLRMDTDSVYEDYLYAYENVTVCRPGVWPVKRYRLAMCTMVRDMDRFLLEWLQYHIYVGVDHVYIYDNLYGDETANNTLTETMAPYINAGYVTVIPWPHEPTPGKTYLEVQIAHENDCVWRHKHNVDWMIKVDVDEFVQPMDPYKPRIPDYLSDPWLRNISSVRLDNWFFGRPPFKPNTTRAYNKSSIFERNQYRPRRPMPQNIGRDKNILQLKNVHFFKIHGVKLGGPSKSADPYHELRVVHYRMDNPRYRSFDLPDFNTKDRSMVHLWKNAKNHWNEIVNGRRYRGLPL